MTEKWIFPKEKMMPGDGWSGGNFYEQLSQNQYPHYHEIIGFFGIQSVFEIGVRAGYSMFAMLTANPGLRFYGVDKLCEDESRPRWAHAIQLATEFPEADIRLEKGNSQKMTELPGRFDLAHVDGNHSKGPALHDIKLCAPYVDLILVDDYNYISTVKDAVDEFLVTCEGVSNWGHIPSYHGHALLVTRDVVAPLIAG